MLDNFGSDFDEFLPHGSQRPVLYRLGQRQTPQEVAKIVSQSEELKANLIIHEIMARKPCPLQGVFTFLDPLFCCATLVVELQYVAVFPAKVRNYKTYSWKKFSRMPSILATTLRAISQIAA